MKKLHYFILLLCVPIISLGAFEWDTQFDKENVVGDISSYASSPVVTPLEKMDFPYQDVKSWIGIGCKEGKEKVYFAFSKAPYLLRTEIHNGYNTLNVRVKVDEEMLELTLSQKWQSKFLHIVSDKAEKEFIQKLKSAKNVLLELQWYTGKVYFNYPLSGAGKSINAMRTRCQPREFSSK